MIYLDSSAILKLIYAERETADLGRWLTARRGAALVSSELAKVEVIRACKRLDGGTVPTAMGVLAAMDLIPVSSSVLDAAAHVGRAQLRSPDAIHLASALAVGSALTAFVAYDHRLLDAAREARLVVEAPAPA